MVNAIILVHPDRLLFHGHICFQYALMAGYNVSIGLVRDWGEAVHLVQARQAEVVIVADEDDLPAARTPRVEIVSHLRPDLYFQALADQEALDGAGPAPVSLGSGRRNERPRVIRRIAAE